MACVVAFLLKLQEITEAPGRIVMVGNDPSGPHYDVFESSILQLPKPSGDIRSNRLAAKLPEDYDDVHSSYLSATYPATFYALYCSPTLKSKEIVTQLKQGMTDCKLQSCRGDILEDKIDEKCLSYLHQSEYNKEGSNEILWSVVRKKIRHAPRNRSSVWQTKVLYH